MKSCIAIVGVSLGRGTLATSFEVLSGARWCHIEGEKVSTKR